MTGTALQASTWTPGHLEHVTGPEAVHCCRAQLTDMPSPQRRRQQQQCPLARQNRRTLCHHTERFGETLRRHTASRDDGYATGQSGRPTKQAQVARMHLCDTASSTCSGGEGAAPCGILWHSMEMSRFCSPPHSVASVIVRGLDRVRDRNLIGPHRLRQVSAIGNRMLDRGGPITAHSALEIGARPGPGL